MVTDDVNSSNLQNSMHQAIGVILTLLKDEKVFVEVFGTIECLSLYCLPMGDDWFLCSTTRRCTCLSVYCDSVHVALKFINYMPLV